MVTLGVVAIVIVFLLGYRYSPNRPVTYVNIREHFKYGSIGSDIENGLPLRVLKVLPRMFPEHLPVGGPKDWTAFGFIQEPGREMPIGFSKRRRVIDLTGLNCAVCHTGLVRWSANGQVEIHLGMPATTVDLQGFFDFLFACAADARFTPEQVLQEVEKDGRLFAPDRLIYRQAIVLLREGLLRRQAQLATFLTPEHTRFGPGRVDTFNPYKINQFASHYQEGIPEEERYGTVDFPSVWHQRPREGMHLHWDGNNTSVFERNISAALGAGATRERVDLPKIERLRAWMNDLPAPPYPFKRNVPEATLRRGEHLYLQYCFHCHDFAGSKVGQVVPLHDIGTDPGRWGSYTLKLAAIQARYATGYDWQWNHFRKTEGYANQPLDGIWARAPYLHNGSVPTLWDLLQLPDSRPREFYVGHAVYDPDKVGLRTDVQEIGGRRSFLFKTTLPGNSNAGHNGRDYGTDLKDEDKQALIEYLKTL